MNPNILFMLFCLFSIAGLCVGLIACVRAFLAARYAAATALVWIALSLAWCVFMRSALEIAK